MKVLVITSDPHEMLMINDTLKEEGYEVVRAINGPSALELAVIEHPSIVIIGEEVNVIEPMQLANILKNNPRIRDIPFVFIGFEDLYTRFSVHDRKIRKPVRKSELVNVINSLAVKEEVQKKVEKKVGRKKEMKGVLEGDRIADFLMTLVNTRADGTLILTKNKERGYVYFENGSIVNASIEKIEGEKALYRLLMWDRCKYEFVPVRSLTPVRIRKPGDVLLIDAVRQIEEYNAFKDKLPLSNLIVTPKITVAKLPPHANPLVKEVILLTEVYRNVEDIVNACTYPDVQVLKTLAALAKKRYIVLRSPSTRMKVKKPFIVPEYLQVLKEKLMGGKGEVRQKVRGVFYLFAWDRRDLDRFKSLASNYSEFSFAFKKSSALSCFARIGKIVISENIEIHIIFLIPCANYFPFYSVLTEEVLGNIILLPTKGWDSEELGILYSYLLQRIPAPIKLCSFGEVSYVIKELEDKKVYPLSSSQSLKDVLNEIIGELQRL